MEDKREGEEEITDNETFRCQVCGNFISKGTPEDQYEMIKHVYFEHPETLPKKNRREIQKLILDIQKEEEENRQEVGDTVDEMTRDGLLHMDEQGHYTVTEKGEKYYEEGTGKKLLRKEDLE